MFSKLLKYDFKSHVKFGLPLTIITLGLGVIGAIDAFFTFRSIAGEIVNEDLSFGAAMFSSLGIMSFFFILFAILICSTVMQIIIYVNYYKSLCSDEGYLTFTLPAKERDILLSKSLNAFIWGAIVVVAVIISIALIILSIYLGVESVSPSEPAPPDDTLFPTENMFDFWSVFFVLLTVILYSLNSTQLVFMVIFFASVITKKNKGLAAIGLVFAANMVYSMLSQLVTSIIALWVGASTTNPDMIIYPIYIVFLAGTGVLYFFLTKRMMERKLNLP